MFQNGTHEMKPRHLTNPHNEQTLPGATPWESLPCQSITIVHERFGILLRTSDYIILSCNWLPRLSDPTEKIIEHGIDFLLIHGLYDTSLLCSVRSQAEIGECLSIGRAPNVVHIDGGYRHLSGMLLYDSNIFLPSLHIRPHAPSLLPTRPNF